MKKGVVLTMMSLLIATFFIVHFSAKIELPIDAQVEVVSFRVTTLNQYKKIWEEYVSGSLQSASYIALSEMSEYVDVNNYLFVNENEFTRNLEECLVSGTMTIFAGTVNCSGSGEKTNFTLDYWLNSLADVVRYNLSINTTFQIFDIDISQQFPFMVTIDMDFGYKIIDVFATIERNISVREYVSIEGIRDTLLGAHRSSDTDRFYKETTTLESEWNKANLTKFILEREYRHRPDSPSFIDRFTADWASKTSACCGIETVFSPKFDNFLLIGTIENASMVDHYFWIDFTGGGPLFTCDKVYKVIDGMGGYLVNTTSNFDSVHINQERLTSFNISASQWVTIC